MDPQEIERQLTLGAERSREASRLPEHVPLHLKIWAKHRWLIIAALLFLLIDLLVLGGVGSTGSGGW